MQRRKIEKHQKMLKQKAIKEIQEKNKIDDLWSNDKEEKHSEKEQNEVEEKYNDELEEENDIKYDENEEKSESEKSDGIPPNELLVDGGADIIQKSIIKAMNAMMDIMYGQELDDDDDELLVIHDVPTNNSLPQITYVDTETKDALQVVFGSDFEIKSDKKIQDVLLNKTLSPNTEKLMETLQDDFEQDDIEMAMELMFDDDDSDDDDNDDDEVQTKEEQKNNQDDDDDFDD